MIAPMLPTTTRPTVTLQYKLTHNEPALRSRLDWYTRQEGIRFAGGTDGEELLNQPANNAEAPPVLKIARNRTSVLWQGEELFFHPGMALLRLLGELRGEKDRFLQAAALPVGAQCVDATMGLAADALMAAWRAGEGGHVQALEASPLIAALIKEGLLNLAHLAPPGVRGLKAEAWRQLIRAGRRIHVVACNHLDYLQTQGSGSLDLVYFDPMFRNTREQSASLRPLKPWICQDPLNVASVQEACRTARRVVLKERNDSPEFARLGFRVLDGGRYSSVAFGALEKGS